MKKVLLTAFMLVVAFAVAANAATYSFAPVPSDLGDLDHTRYYSWGINWTHTSEYITGATLRINHIWDWTHEVDSLYIHLLDNPTLGVTSGFDNEGGGDHFAGTPWISTWSDPYGDALHKANLAYDLGALGLLPTLNTYAANGRFGFGFDADCHYYNDGVQLCVTTSTTPPNTVPEPGMLTLLGIGLTGVATYVRRKK